MAWKAQKMVNIVKNMTCKISTDDIRQFGGHCDLQVKTTGYSCHGCVTAGLVIISPHYKEHLAVLFFFKVFFSSEMVAVISARISHS